MDTEHIHINVNLAALLGELQQALQVTINLVSLSLSAAIPDSCKDLRLPAGGVSTVFDQRQNWSKDEAARNFRIWTLSNGLRDVVESASAFIESTHKVLTAWDLLERQKAQGRLKRSEWNDELNGAAFHRLGLPDKLDHLNEKHGIAPDPKLLEQLLGINAARNCLVHRRGVVSQRDLNAGTSLTVGWRKIHFFVQDEDGESPRKTRRPFTLSQAARG